MWGVLVCRDVPDEWYALDVGWTERPDWDEPETDEEYAAGMAWAESQVPEDQS